MFSALSTVSLFRATSHQKTLPMEVVGSRVPWPLDAPRAADALLRGFAPQQWRKVASGAPLEAMSPYLSFNVRFNAVGTFAMEISKIAEATDDQGRQVLVYQVQPEAWWPQAVKQYVTFCFREIPAAPLILSWHFEVDDVLFQGAAYSLAGNIVDRVAYGLPEGAEIMMEELLRSVKLSALANGLIESYNRDVRMFLEGSSLELPHQGILWSHSASFAAPRRRIRGKTDFSRWRFARWIEALIARRAVLGTDPASFFEA